MPYTQSKQYLRDYARYAEHTKNRPQDIESKLLQYVLANTPKNDPIGVLRVINDFCKQYWMMNIGEQKGDILVTILKKTEPTSILELGGYCGYSALLMAANSHAFIHTIEPNQHFANIATQIHEHAGLADRIIIHLGTVQSQQHFIKGHGKFDLILIDHVKHLYLQDFKQLQKLHAIQQGTFIFGDNIIYPGSPDYLKHIQHNSNYDSTLYHSYLEYSNLPDAVLVSERIME